MADRMVSALELHDVDLMRIHKAKQHRLLTSTIQNGLMVKQRQRVCG